MSIYYNPALLQIFVISFVSSVIRSSLIRQRFGSHQFQTNSKSLCSNELSHSLPLLQQNTTQPLTQPLRISVKILAVPADLKYSSYGFPISSDHIDIFFMLRSNASHADSIKT